MTNTKMNSIRVFLILIGIFQWINCERICYAFNNSFTPCLKLTDLSIIFNLNISIYKAIEFDFNTLSNKIPIINFDSLNQTFFDLRKTTIILKNIEKINKNSITSLRPFILLNDVLMSNINLDFFYLNQTLSKKSICNSFLNISKTKSKIYLASIMATNLVFTDSVIFAKELCPIIFYGSVIEYIHFYNLSQENTLNFIKSDYSNSFQASIFSVFIENSKISLDNRFFDEVVFKQLTELSILNSSLTYISDRTFSTFEKLKFINLTLNNFDVEKYEFNNLFKSLNFRSKILDLKDCLSVKEYEIRYHYFKMIIILKDLSKSYRYPEKDFCLFKDFPHNRVVFPIINGKKNLICTCTLLWLLVNHELKKYIEKTYSPDSIVSMNTSSTRDCFIDFDAKIKICDFHSRLRDQCGIYISENDFRFTCNMKKEYNTESCFLRLFEIVLIFFISLVGLTLNLLIFTILLSEKQEFFIYLKIKLGFQIISLVTFIFNLFIDSLNKTYKFPRDSCALDFRLKNFQAIELKIKFIDTIGHIAISCSILTTLFMLLTYLPMVCKAKKIFNFNFISVLALGIILNLDRIFQYLNSVYFMGIYYFLKDLFLVLIFFLMVLLKLSLIKLFSLKVKNNLKRNIVILTFQSIFLILAQVMGVCMAIKRLNIQFEFFNSKQLNYNQITSALKIPNNIEKYYLIFTNFVFICEFFLIYFLNSMVKRLILDFLKQIFFIFSAK